MDTKKYERKPVNEIKGGIYYLNRGGLAIDLEGKERNRDTGPR